MTKEMKDIKEKITDFFDSHPNVVSVLIFLALVLIIAIGIKSCDSSSGGGSRGTARCSVCGAKYSYQDDSSGNWKSIQYSGMCNKCKRSYNYYKAAKNYPY